MGLQNRALPIPQGTPCTVGQTMNCVLKKEQLQMKLYYNLD